MQDEDLLEKTTQMARDDYMDIEEGEKTQGNETANFQESEDNLRELKQIMYDTRKELNDLGITDKGDIARVLNKMHENNSLSAKLAAKDLGLVDKEPVTRDNLRENLNKVLSRSEEQAQEADLRRQKVDLQEFENNKGMHEKFFENIIDPLTETDKRRLPTKPYWNKDEPHQAKSETEAAEGSGVNQNAQEPTLTEKFRTKVIFDDAKG